MFRYGVVQVGRGCSGGLGGLKGNVEGIEGEQRGKQNLAESLKSFFAI